MNPVKWQTLGKIELCQKGWPKFPAVEKVAGLYRLTLDDGWRYIGQAQNLQHRLYEYRRPTQGVVQEHSIHRAITRARGAIVEVFISDDLKDSKRRCALEQQEIEIARRAGDRLLNGGSNIEEYRLKLAHRIPRTRAKVATCKASSVRIEWDNPYHKRRQRRSHHIMKSRLEARAPFVLRSELVAFVDGAEGYGLDEITFPAGTEIFVDLAFWKGTVWNGIEVIKFTKGTRWFCARNTDLEAAITGSSHI